jgi:hypothetical protein
MRYLHYLGERLAAARDAGRLGDALVRGPARELSRLRYLRPDPTDRRFTIHAPGLVEPDPADAALVSRITDAYRRMKEDERTASPLYRPSPQWQAVIDDAFVSLADRPEVFLANFGAWPQETGIESTGLIATGARTEAGRRALKRDVFGPLLAAWEAYWAGSRSLEKLEYPRHGNQIGAFLEGDTFVGPGSFFNDIYGSMLDGIVADVERPVIADLGGGYGKLAWFTLRDREQFAFVDFDLPEVLCTAAYFLMKSFPERRTLLYGEGPFALDGHDLVFMPPWVLAELGPQSVDLFVNKNSLGEMTAAAARNYVRLIADSTRYFFHLNHERFRNDFGGGERSLLASEYEVPEALKLLLRLPELGHGLVPDSVGGGSDIYLYLYERAG